MTLALLLLVPSLITLGSVVGSHRRPALLPLWLILNATGWIVAVAIAGMVSS